MKVLPCVIDRCMSKRFYFPLQWMILVDCRFKSIYMKIRSSIKRSTAQKLHVYCYMFVCVNEEK